jgi:hypothetical protein
MKYAATIKVQRRMELMAFQVEYRYGKPVRHTSMVSIQPGGTVETDWDVDAWVRDGWLVPVLEPQPLTVPVAPDPVAPPVVREVKAVVLDTKLPEQLNVIVQSPVAPVHGSPQHPLAGLDEEAPLAPEFPEALKVAMLPEEPVVEVPPEIIPEVVEEVAVPEPVVEPEPEPAPEPEVPRAKPSAKRKKVTRRQTAVQKDKQ